MALVEALRYEVVPVAFGSFKAIYDLIENDKNGSIITPFDLEEFSLKLKEQMLNTKKESSWQSRELLLLKFTRLMY